jgi:hypothetical protein
VLKEIDVISSRGEYQIESGFILYDNFKLIANAGGVARTFFVEENR